MKTKKELLKLLSEMTDQKKAYTLVQVVVLIADFTQAGMSSDETFTEVVRLLEESGIKIPS